MNINHIAIIMDGNRRWAKAHNLPLLEGHRRGAEKIEPLVDFAISTDISYLTFWAFSTENWNRDEKEVTYLLNLFREGLLNNIAPKLAKKGVRIQTIGDMTRFPQDIQDQVTQITEQTKENQTCTVTFALNYGGRDEIIRSVNKLLKAGTSEITSDVFETYLDTAGMPDPEIIIRTGGERRLSGYLPWQGVYSELFFPEMYWPDFTPEVLQSVIDEFENRERRFGK